MKRLFLGIYLGVVVTVPAYAQLKASSERTLTINETLASDKLQRVGNSVMVPLADVAKALGLSIVKTKTGYALLKGGGANQVEGLRGKLGETLFDGKWRFTVQSVRNETSYSVETKTTTDYAVTSAVAEQDGPKFTPKSGHFLVVFRCEAKNAQTSPQQLWWSQSDVRTALTDDRGQSYPPLITDIASPSFQSKPILPGARLEFNLVFCVPHGTQVQDLVFTLRTILDKGSDVRIALGNPRGELIKRPEGKD